MSSLDEVARRAGVSKATASRALSGAAYVSDATRARVEEAADALGYVVSAAASSLVTGRTRTIGVVLPEFNRWFHAEVLEGVQTAAAAADHDLALHRAADPAERARVFSYFLLRKRVDAVVAIGLALSRDETAALDRLGRPAIVIGGPLPGITTLSMDDEAAGRLVTEHLLSLGHRRIVHLGGGDDEQPEFHAQATRLAGFRAAMAAAGAGGGDDLRIAPYSIPGGYRAAIELLAHPHDRPTAIVAGCDEIAIGAITAARQLGILVPAELSVVGIDDHALAGMFGLTTMRQDPRAQGERAVRHLLAAIETPDAPAARLRIPTSLTVRSSSTAPRVTPPPPRG